jgi:hypothetical protein
MHVALAEYLIRAGQAAWVYSWKLPLSRVRLRMPRLAIVLGPSIGAGSGWRGCEALMSATAPETRGKTSGKMRSGEHGTTISWRFVGRCWISTRATSGLLGLDNAMGYWFQCNGGQRGRGAGRQAGEAAAALPADRALHIPAHPDAHALLCAGSVFDVLRRPARLGVLGPGFAPHAETGLRCADPYGPRRWPSSVNAGLLMPPWRAASAGGRSGVPGPVGGGIAVGATGLSPGWRPADQGEVSVTDAAALVDLGA